MVSVKQNEFYWNKLLIFPLTRKDYVDIHHTSARYTAGHFPTLARDVLIHIAVIIMRTTALWEQRKSVLLLLIVTVVVGNFYPL